MNLELEQCLVQGDCLYACSNLKISSIALIYLDPPFGLSTRHKLTNREGAVYYFDDYLSDRAAYENYMHKRISAMYSLLKSSGSIFLHCVPKTAHWNRTILDDIFGASNFRSEIIWTYRRWSNSKNGLLNSHQTILFYSKTERFKFNKIMLPYSINTNINQIRQLRTRNKYGKTVYARDINGAVIYGGSKRGVPLGDVWELPYLNPKAKERCGYPTQKPLALLERIISICSDEGDLILDPFMGSGTTCVAAKKLKRLYIGIDINPSSIELAKERLKT